MTLRSSAVRQLIRTQGGRWCRRGCRISPHGHVLGSRAHIRHQPGACDAVPPARGPWCPARLPSLSAHPGSIHAVSWLGNQCLSRASVSDTGLGLGVERRCEGAPGVRPRSGGLYIVQEEKQPPKMWAGPSRHSETLRGVFHPSQRECLLQEGGLPTSLLWEDHTGVLVCRDLMTHLSLGASDGSDVVTERSKGSWRSPITFCYLFLQVSSKIWVCQ